MGRREKAEKIARILKIFEASVKGLPSSSVKPHPGKLSLFPMFTAEEIMKKTPARNFFPRIYDLVEKIPKGSVMTYGQISHLLNRPRAAKFVGFAMAKAPAHLPCHRVVNRLGQMAPGMIFGGEDVQREKLRTEDVPFLANGRVDLSEALFDPEEL